MPLFHGGQRHKRRPGRFDRRTVRRAVQTHFKFFQRRDYARHLRHGKQGRDFNRRIAQRNNTAIITLAQGVLNTGRNRFLCKLQIRFSRSGRTFIHASRNVYQKCDADGWRIIDRLYGKHLLIQRSFHIFFVIRVRFA